MTYQPHQSEDPTTKPVAQFPAAFTMHWAGEPVHVCVKHGRQLIGLARAMGGGLSFGGSIVPPEAPEGAECSNCVNERAAGVPGVTHG